MEPVAQFLEERLQIPLPVPRTVLRPPGAQPEREFLATCYRCGNCVDVCPAKAIRTIPRTTAPYAAIPISTRPAACVRLRRIGVHEACPAARSIQDQAADIRMGWLT
jgi:ferredoxin-type protein NapG